MADLKKLVLLCAVTMLALLGSSVAQDAQVSQSVNNDISPAVSDLPTVSGAPSDSVTGEGAEGPENPTPGPLLGDQGVSQGNQTINLPANLASITGNFAGLSVNAAAGGFFAPPDTVGAVGNGQYVQAVNVAFAVFDKNSGVTLAGPFLIKSLWAGFGGDCETHNNGDPIVQYDKIANRWVISQFTIDQTAPGKFFECVAVSTTADATGTFARYAFPQFRTNADGSTTPLFPDYPKLATWPDAYYVAYNTFNTAGSSSLGVRACAMDRTIMLIGIAAATQVCFQRVATPAGPPETRSYNNLLPADFEGTQLPPAGTPEMFISQGFFSSANFLQMWRFHVDFGTPANSTFSTTPQAIIVPTFAAVCLAQSRQACIPQPPTTPVFPPTGGSGSAPLESLTARLMHRATWRMAGGREELLASATVDVGGGRSGIRWYESQNPRAVNPTFFQAANFGPQDGKWRWMPSIAMDKMGNIAVGYSVSDGVSTFPSIAFTGRLRSELRNVLEPETTLWNGTGAQQWRVTGTPPAPAYLARWGDYSGLTVDPADDCTFYYTTEYIPTNGVFNWATRIASFKFPNCK